MATPKLGARIRRPTVGERIRAEGLWGVARSYLGDRYAGFARRLAHRYVAPRISESFRRAGLQTTDPDALLAAVPGLDGARLALARAELPAVEEALRARYRSDLPYPIVSAFSGAESRLIYALVRAMAPERVVETGVANGHSSALILEALARNGVGRLLSIDVRSDVGALVPEPLRARWDLTILGLRGPRAALDRALEAVPSIDLFIHDSDHAYAWQRREYELAWRRLSQRGVLASDDVDWSFAFLDFAEAVGRRPSILVSESKAFGVLTRAEPA